MLEGAELKDLLDLLELVGWAEGPMQQMEEIVRQEQRELTLVVAAAEIEMEMEAEMEVQVL